MTKSWARRAAALAISGAAILALDGTAMADHSHDLITPGTTVVDVARGQTGKATGPGCHRFHENVHLGAADSDGFLGHGHSRVRVVKTESGTCVR
jgi:hypothetical protein